MIRTRCRTRCRLGAYARVHLPRGHRAPRPRLLRAPRGSRSQLGVVRSLASQSAAHLCEASTWRSALGAPHKQWSMSFLQSHLGEASLRALASIRPPPRDPRTLPALMDPGAPHGLLHSLLPRLARISIGCVRIEPRGKHFRLHQVLRVRSIAEIGSGRFSCLPCAALYSDPSSVLRFSEFNLD